MVVSFAELEEKKQPPRSIWLNDEALNEHFRSIRNSSSGTEEIPDLQQNELTRDLR